MLLDKKVFLIFFPILIFCQNLEKVKFLQKEKIMVKENNEFSWDLTKMYPSMADWHIELKKMENEKKNNWQNILEYKGKLQNTDSLKIVLDKFFTFSRELENLLIYAHHVFDEDLRKEEGKKAYSMVSSLVFQFQEDFCWVEPEILSIKKEKLLEISKDKKLLEYKFYLERLIRAKNHVLSLKEEKLLARAEKPLGVGSRAFGSFNNADIFFEKVKDSKGNSFELTHGTYNLFLKSKDRMLRKSAFENLHKKFLTFENTLTELLQGKVEAYLFFAKSKNFKNCMHASLFPNNIDTKVYDTLIDTVRENISVLHKYIRLKKRFLKIENFCPFDIYAPLIEGVDFKISIEEAKDKVISSVKILGEKYQNILRKGLKQDRWVDFLEKKGKRSGAYSSGSFDSMPYILMNFQGSLNDLFTLAHEAGHSMHSYLSRKNQPYQYSRYPIFLAEIASTFNEQLLFDMLLKNYSKDKKMKAYLLCKKLEAIYATFFRQTLFAEFEKKIHFLAENYIPLTPQLLKKEYLDLYSFYFGKDLILDESIAIEWARIPHFYYYNFYVYQYATGICAANYFFNLIKKDKKCCEEYLKFLKSGSNDYPLKILKKASLDLRDKKVIESLIKYFDGLIDQVSEILEKMEKK